nr:amidohydrolase family protein [uncultured Sphingomonas sp.]
MFIRDAELRGGDRVDVRIANGTIVEIGALCPADETVIRADGALLIPGLHDHHLHVAATAAAAASIRCGPPEIADAAALAGALGQAGDGWLRGIGYHESVAGMIDRHWLDRVNRDRPVRVQHRSGRMWVFNSAGLDVLYRRAADAGDRLERDAGGPTGRLVDADAWLRRVLDGSPPSFAAIGKQLAHLGVTGITDMTVSNDWAMAEHFAREHAAGALPQRIVLAGTMRLAAGLSQGVALGPLKVHLHEAHLPDHDMLIADMKVAHVAQRAVAVHCVTEVELVFALAAFAAAGTIGGDRIEHASIAPPALIEQIATLALIVVTQPNFVRERGDAYRCDLPQDIWPDLYRLATWKRYGVPLAAGTDAPFGDPDPWAAMAAAVDRRTAHGATIGADEALTPEAALDLFLADPFDLRRTRTVAIGGVADVCLLDAPWSVARAALSAERVDTTIIAGRIVHDRIDQPDRHRGARADPPPR